MSDKIWTNSQNDAINAINGTVLVSAAAGSGKTAVLVERVIKRLTDENNCCEADRLLIVTFTKSAANEMRERISDSILKLLEKDPFNYRLQRQQMLLCNAKISTIHSFCNDLVRENFYKFDIPPDFRIADSNEILVIRNEAMESVLDDMYEVDNPEFKRLSEIFSLGRDDKVLIENIQKIYDFIRSHPFPEDWLDEKLSMYDLNGPLNEDLWIKTIIKFCEDTVNYCILLIKNNLYKIEGDLNLQKAYGSTINNDLYRMLDLLKVLKIGDLKNISESLMSLHFDRLGALRGYNNEIVKEQIKNARDEVKKLIGKLQKSFSYNEQQCIDDIKELKIIMNQLFTAVKNFSKKFDELKRNKKVADFSDLEHWALKLLVKKTENGFEKTNEAIEISKCFDEVMVDEYQDTNEVQDMIFRAISNNEKNMFLVGDIKQSIYRFRQAMPEIFLRRKNSYVKYDNKIDNYPSKIIFDKNFRSREGIIDAINFVFEQIMSKDVGEVEYKEDEKLVYSGNYLKKQTPDVSLKIIDISQSNEDNIDILEAEYIGKTILNMIKNEFKIKDKYGERNVTFKDFCILLRSTKKHSHVIAKRLNDIGVPAWSEKSGSFFGTPEVSTILSILRILDNPIQDIPLVSTMMSPIYGFNPDEISAIRMSDKSKPIYFALKNFVCCNDNKLSDKCRKFINDIETFRTLSYKLTVGELINYIYEITGYTYIVQTMSQGEFRLCNLRLLLEYAKTYEKSGYDGLSDFIRFIDNLEEQKADLNSSTSISENLDVVKVMSIHSSKGLEFPVCIVANCSRKFNKMKESVLLNSNLGIGVKLKDKTLMRQYSNLQRDAVSLEMERENMSEELRVLYVAMTRAKEKLILITSLKDPQKTLTKLSSRVNKSKIISPYVVRNSESFSDLILCCALKHPDGTILRQISGNNYDVVLESKSSWDIEIVSQNDMDDFKILEKCEGEKQSKCDDNLLKVIDQRLKYKYPFELLNEIPTKVSASEISKSDNINKSLIRPNFMEKNGMSPTEKGTALHKFMEYADYNEAKNNLTKHLSYLKEKKFLTNEQCNSIDLLKLKAFFDSNIFKRIISSSKFYREYRFTVDIEIKDLYSEFKSEYGSERVILQGAVDCAFLEEEKMVIVDYKTDKVNSIEDLKNRYYKQMEIYSKSLSRIFELKIKECVIYSFYLNKEIIIKFD